MKVFKHRIDSWYALIALIVIMISFSVLRMIPKTNKSRSKLFGTFWGCSTERGGANLATENHIFFKECNDILAEIYFKITEPKHIMVTDMYREVSKGNSILLRLDASLIFANSERFCDSHTLDCNSCRYHSNTRTEHRTRITALFPNATWH